MYIRRARGPQACSQAEMTKRNKHTAAQGPLPLREASLEILGLDLETHLCAPHPPEGWRAPPA